MSYPTNLRPIEQVFECHQDTATAAIADLFARLRCPHGVSIVEWDDRLCFALRYLRDAQECLTVGSRYVPAAPEPPPAPPSRRLVAAPDTVEIDFSDSPPLAAAEPF